MTVPPLPMIEPHASERTRMRTVYPAADMTAGLLAHDFCISASTYPSAAQTASCVPPSCSVRLAGSAGLAGSSCTRQPALVRMLPSVAPSCDRSAATTSRCACSLSVTGAASKSRSGSGPSTHAGLAATTASMSAAELLAAGCASRSAIAPPASGGGAAEAAGASPSSPSLTSNLEATRFAAALAAASSSAKPASSASRLTPDSSGGSVGSDVEAIANFSVRWACLRGVLPKPGDAGAFGDLPTGGGDAVKRLGDACLPRSDGGGSRA